ncbi:MAG: DUF2971 domain-containing protein [Candidatus Binataceae bacterium]
MADTLLWRYMDLAKFVSLLQSRTLHFCRGDMFSDPFEGSYPANNLADFGADADGYDAQAWRRFVVVSCWHAADGESDAMWRLYSKGGYGIAITSSRESLQKAADDGYVIDVKYIDFIAGKADLHIPSDVFEYKRRAFEHESEVRVIITRYPQTGFEGEMPRLSRPMDGQEFPERGYAVDIDLGQLINNVVISPSAPDWFFEVVQRLVVKYELREQLVTRSSLLADPVYARMSYA